MLDLDPILTEVRWLVHLKSRGKRAFSGGQRLYHAEKVARRQLGYHNANPPNSLYWGIAAAKNDDDAHPIFGHRLCWLVSRANVEQFHGL